MFLFREVKRSWPDPLLVRRSYQNQGTLALPPSLTGALPYLYSPMNVRGPRQHWLLAAVTLHGRVEYSGGDLERALGED